MYNGRTGLIDDERSANGQGKTLMLLGQIVEPLVMRDNALQGPIASICIRLAAMETGDSPRRDTGVIDDWDDNDTPCLLALREGAKLGDDQPLDLVFGHWDFFHGL
jgi:hypothetical protein